MRSTQSSMVIFFLLIPQKLKGLCSGKQWETKEDGILGPSLGAVTALWKYHLFLTARRAWPSDSLYLHSGQSAQCHLKAHKEPASMRRSIFCFSRSCTPTAFIQTIISIRFDTYCMLQSLHRSRCFGSPDVTFKRCHLANATLEVIWFSSSLGEQKYRV